MKTEDKIELVKKTFQGRLDVVPKYWVSKNGSGYSPMCANEWKEDICNKPDGKCASCKNKEYIPLSDKLILDHLTGNHIIGVYPLLKDNTCWFLASDFDDHDRKRNPLEDVKKFIEVCQFQEIPCYALRSKSGNGFHTFTFFNRPVPAWKARTVVFALLQEAGVLSENAKITSFDRLFPNQDELSGKGLGNLIALPLQGKAVEAGHTVFLDPKDCTTPLPNIWEALSSIKRVNESALDHLIEEWGLEKAKSVITKTANPEGWLLEALKGVKETNPGRDKTGIKIAGYYVDLLPKEEILTLMLAWDSRNIPPLGEDLINKIVDSSERYREKPESNIILLERGWGEPADVFTDTLSWQPQWRKTYAPEVITDMGFDMAERMGLRPEQIIGPAIINMSGVIDDEWMIQPKEYDDSWLQSARLWAVIIGESGAKKSPAKRQVDQIMKRIQGEMYDEYRDEMDAYQLLSKKEKEKAPSPIFKRVIVNDTTVEGLRDILDTKGGARKIICSWDEMSGFFGSFDVYKPNTRAGKERPAYLELYDGGLKTFDRAGQVNFYIPNWSACISGTITPGNMKAYFGKLHSDGLLQRFLLYLAENLNSGADRVPRRDFIEKYESTVRKINRLIPEHRAIFRLSKEAQDIRQDINKHVTEVKFHCDATGALETHLDKYDGLFSRVLLTYHFVESISNGQEKPDTRIPGELAAMVGASFIKYHMPVAIKFYKTLGYDHKDTTAEERVCSYILTGELKKVTPRDLSRNVRSINDVHHARRVLESLEIFDWVKISRTDKQGKPTEWDINPIVHNKFKAFADSERERKKERKIKMARAFDIIREDYGDDDHLEEEET
jgi:hypothetical protein